MKVILIERVPTLGNVGEIVNVSQGHARNFLIPKKLAILADEGNKRQVEDQRRRLNKKVEAQKNEALDMKKKIESITLDFTRRVGANGKLFGTITSGDLSKELETRGLNVERRLMVIENPIKKLGTFEVKVKLFTEVEAKFKVKVTMDAKQVEEEKLRLAQASKKSKDKKKDAAAEGEEVAVKAEAAEEASDVQEEVKKEVKKEKKPRKKKE